MATQKITKKDNFKALLSIVEDLGRNDLVDFINHEIELLDKKKSNGNAKANKQVADNVELVYNALASVGKAVTVTELIAQTDLTALANEEHIVTTQRVRAYIGKLIESGRVKSYKDKKKTLFEIVATDTDSE